jgi:hypothetical protein
MKRIDTKEIFEQWASSPQEDDPTLMDENCSEIPEPGDTVRTNKTSMDGKVESVNESGEVFFRIADGRLMKTHCNNVTVVEKLADENNEVMEDQDLMELSNELLSKYKTGAADSSRSANAMGDIKKSNKRFSGVVKATNKQFANDAKKAMSGLKEDNSDEQIAQNLGIPVKGVPYIRALLNKEIRWNELPQQVRMPLYKKFEGLPTDLDQNTSQGMLQVIHQAMAEGSMGGINRSAPAADVSYENVLNRNPESAHSRVIGEDTILSDVMEKWQQVNELSVNSLKSYAEKAKHSSPEHDKVKTMNHIRGYHTAKDKIAKKTGDRTATREAEDPFKKQLNKQHKPVKKVEEKDYNGWKIRYQLVPSKPGAPLQWMVWHSKGSPEKAHKGTSQTPKQAIDDATDWINSGGGEKKTVNKNVTIDFNTNFSQQFAPGNETFYATVDDGHLLFSAEPQPGFKQSVKRHADRYTFQSITLTPRDFAAAGLVPHGRYALGPPQEFAPGVQMFPIQFQGTAAHSGDKLRMGEPGFTAATERSNEVDEAMHPWKGYTPDDKKANALAKAPKSSMQGSRETTFSQLVQDTIATHGVKWAFDYYVVKHGLPPRQFRIFSGI